MEDLNNCTQAATKLIRVGQDTKESIFQIAYEEEFQDNLDDRHGINFKFVVLSLSSINGSSRTNDPCTSLCSGDPDIKDPQPQKKITTTSSRTNSLD